MSDAAISERRAASQLGNILDMRRAHDPRVVDAHVHEQLVKFDVLLRVGVKQVMKLQSRYGQHGLPVEFGVIEAVEEVNAARARSCQAHSEPARPFGVAAGHEGRGLLVANLNEPDLLLTLAEGFDDSIDAVAGNSEYDFHAPMNQSVDEHVGCVNGHSVIHR